VKAIGLGCGLFRERFAVARPRRFGAFLSLIAAVTAPSLISNSPWHDGHFRREETITVCIEVYTICSLQSGQVKGWSKKSSLTGRTGEMVTKSAFAYPSPGPESLKVLA